MRDIRMMLPQNEVDMGTEAEVWQSEHDVLRLVAILKELYAKVFEESLKQGAGWLPKGLRFDQLTPYLSEKNKQPKNFFCGRGGSTYR